MSVFKVGTKWRFPTSITAHIRENVWEIEDVSEISSGCVDLFADVGVDDDGRMHTMRESLTYAYMARYAVPYEEPEAAEKSEPPTAKQEAVAHAQETLDTTETPGRETERLVLQNLYETAYQHGREQDKTVIEGLREKCRRLMGEQRLGQLMQTPSVLEVVTELTPEHYSELAKRTDMDYGPDPMPGADTFVGRCRLHAVALHGALGVSSEAGEIADAVKKAIMYGRKLDKTNLIEEVGDMLWYLNLVLEAADATFTDAMEFNIAKLAKRYPDGFKDVEVRDYEAEREAGLEAMSGKV